MPIVKGQEHSLHVNFMYRLQCSCPPVHYCVLHGGIRKLFGMNNHLKKTMCHLQEPCCLLDGPVTLHMQSLYKGCIGNIFMYSPLLCLVYSVISNYLAWLTVLTSQYVECKNHVASLKAKVTVHKLRS